MEKTFFEELKLRAIMAAMSVNRTAEDKDVKRNHVNYGELTAWTRLLRDMGHETDTPVWEDREANECLKIPRLKIDGETVIEFEKA